jgi:hypothetical protein
MSIRNQILLSAGGRGSSVPNAHGYCDNMSRRDLLNSPGAGYGYIPKHECMGRWHDYDQSGVSIRHPASFTSLASPFSAFSEIIGIHGWHKFKLGTKPYEQWFGYDRYLRRIPRVEKNQHRTPSSATK